VAFGVDEPLLKLRCAAISLDDLAHDVRVRAAVLLVGQVAQVQGEHILAAVADDLAQGAVDVDQPALQRHDRHPDRRAVKARPEALRRLARLVAQAAVQPAGDDPRRADERDEHRVTRARLAGPVAQELCTEHDADREQQQPEVLVEDQQRQHEEGMRPSRLRVPQLDERDRRGQQAHRDRHALCATGEGREVRGGRERRGEQYVLGDLVDRLADRKAEQGEGDGVPPEDRPQPAMALIPHVVGQIRPMRNPEAKPPHAQRIGIWAPHL